MKGFKLGGPSNLHRAKSLEDFLLCNACSVVSIRFGVAAKSWSRGHDETHVCQRIKYKEFSIQINITLS
jgi:hypothetical protein